MKERIGTKHEKRAIIRTPQGGTIVTEAASVTSLMRHDPVLVALKQLSGKDFGFNQTAWQGWWVAEGQRLFGDTKASPQAVKVPRKKQAQSTLQ